MAPKAPKVKYIGPSAEEIAAQNAQQLAALGALQNQYQSQYQAQLGEVQKGYQTQIEQLQGQFAQQQQAQSGLLSQLNTQLSAAQQQNQQQSTLYNSLLQTQQEQVARIGALSDAATANANVARQQATGQAATALGKQSNRLREQQKTFSLRGSPQVADSILRSEQPTNQLLR